MKSALESHIIELKKLDSDTLISNVLRSSQQWVHLKKRKRIPDAEASERIEQDFGVKNWD
jgi:hypothetical protein